MLRTAFIMTIADRRCKGMQDKLKASSSRLYRKRDALLPVLQDIQGELGLLNLEAMAASMRFFLCNPRGIVAACPAENLMRLCWCDFVIHVGLAVLFMALIEDHA